MPTMFDLDFETVLAPTPRGAASAALIELISWPPASTTTATGDLATMVNLALATSSDLLTDDDLQLTLFMLYLLHYGPAPYMDERWEWHPGLLEVRARIEDAFEDALRATVKVPSLKTRTGDDVSTTLFELTDAVARPGLATWASKHATAEQLQEFLVLRSIYTLREADPHSWAIPRLQGRAKAALVEIQSDEYGGGQPERVHAEIFARGLRAMNLSDIPDFYLDLVPAVTLTSVNTMSLFGLHRRLRGSIVGHLAAFEMTSSIPNKYYARAFRRLGYGHDVTWYYDEHVEADAVHEQIAARDLAGSLADDEPHLADDIVFGACASLYVDGLVADHMENAWKQGRSALREPQ